MVKEDGCAEAQIIRTLTQRLNSCRGSKIDKARAARSVGGWKRILTDWAELYGELRRR
jgi:hypothetical protein